MESIFNEKVVEKWDLWDLWTLHESTVHGRKVKKLRLKEKKKKKILKRKRASEKCKMHFSSTLSIKLVFVLI